MTNTNPDTGIRYGIISANALDPELVCTLQDRGVDLHWEEALADLKKEVEREADAIEEEVLIGIAEVDYALVGNEDHEERKITAAYVRLRYSDREEYIGCQMQDRVDAMAWQWQDEEPTHEGTYEDVHYRTTWLGGALLVFITQSPVISRARVCSPCVPNAGDLDSPDPDGVECYGVPNDWRHQP